MRWPLAHEYSKSNSLMHLKDQPGAGAGVTAKLGSSDLRPGALALTCGGFASV